MPGLHPRRRRQYGHRSPRAASAGQARRLPEGDDLERMLEAVAVIHGGLIEDKERIIARTVRVLAEQH